MQRLRSKIALLFVAAIVAVVLVATGITWLVITSGDAHRMIEPMARQITMSREFIAARESGRPPAPPPMPHQPATELRPAPAEGVVRQDLASALQSTLDAGGTVVVTQGEDAALVASLQLDDGRWMIVPFPSPRPPPPELWLALGSWLGIVVAGVVTVALVVAHRVTQPFAILESAVASVGPDGVLPHTPETGSGEARQMASALNALSERLRAAMESRMRLVAAAGHDLRTPMTRMRLRAEFLADDERASWLADLDELESIADSAIRLVREEVAGEDRGPVALDASVRETVDELAAAGLPAIVVAAEAATVTAGPLALKRALRNLVTNAATHGGGARVTLSAGEGVARLVIDDDGPGIPEPLLAQVFEPFFRASPARTQTTKGAGLGLAIAKEIVERFGGAIEIANRPEGGLRQVVTLPLAQVRQGQLLPPLPVSSGAVRPPRRGSC